MADNADVSDAGSGRRPWQGRESDAPGAASPQARRPVGFLILVGLFLALASIAIVWLLLIRKPPKAPYFLTINIGDYNSRHYPSLAFAAQDAELLLRHFPADSKKQAVTKSKKLLREQLKALEGLSNQPLIVHLAALAFVRGETVFLLPGDADPDDEATWLDVQEVFDAVKACPAAQKLLILDVVHPLASARLGVLADRVAKTLEEKMRKEEPTYHVLLPCSRGQFASASEAIQASALAYYLDQGLQGHADSNKNDAVRLLELIEFARPRIDRWSRSNFGVRQEPRLFGKGADFPIVSIHERTPTALAVPKLGGYPEVLMKAWQGRDDAWDAGAFQRAPRQLLKLDASLLRLEERWQQGLVPVKSLDDETQNLVQELDKALAIPRPPHRSLALIGAKPNAVLAEAIYQTLLEEPDPKKTPADHLKKQQAEILKKLKEDKKIDFSQQAATTIEALNRVKQPAPAHFQAAYGALAALRAKPSFIEVLFLQRVVEFAKEQDPDWPRDKVVAAWQTMRSQQVVLASLERAPEGLPWVAADLGRAEQLRLAGERKLFRERPSTWEDAHKKLLAAKETYEQTRQKLELMGSARFELDRALALLPAFAEHLCDWPEEDLQAERAWFGAAGEAFALHTFFSNPPALDAKLSVHTRQLKDYLDELDEALDLRIRAAQKEVTGKARHQLCRLLSSPLLKSAKRGELADKQRRLAVKLHEATDKLDQEDIQAARSPRPADWPAAATERSAPLLRAKTSLALAGLAGEDKKDLPTDQPNVSEREVNVLEKALHALWGSELLDRWRTSRPTPANDVLNRLISPWDWNAKVGAAQRDASLLLQKDQRKSYLRWLAANYQAEAQFLETNTYDRPASEFFVDAAEKLRLHLSGLE